MTWLGRGFAVLLLSACALSWGQEAAPRSWSAAPGLPSGAQTQAVVESLPVAQVLGPLAPVALSPFFGLLCLSQMSLMHEQGALPQNLLLEDHPLLQDWRFFGLLLFLTLMTSAPKLFTVSKFFAQAVDQVEAYSGLVLYLLVIMIASLEPAPQSQDVLHAGLLDLGQSGLLMIACVVNFVLVNTVKYFFELLALITPVPLLDAAFEIANKSLCLGLALLYAYNPYIALIPAAFIFLVSLALFYWARRGMKYYKTLLVDPLWKGLASRVLGRPLPEVPIGIASRISHALGERMHFIAKAFPERTLGGFHARDLCYLAATATGVYLVQAPSLRPPLILPLRGYRLRLTSGLLARKVLLLGAEGEQTLVISRYANIAAAAGALGEQPVEARLGVPTQVAKRDIRGELG